MYIARSHNFCFLLFKRLCSLDRPPTCYLGQGRTSFLVTLHPFPKWLLKNLDTQLVYHKRRTTPPQSLQLTNIPPSLPSNDNQSIPLHPIMVSMLLHDYELYFLSLPGVFRRHFNMDNSLSILQSKSSEWIHVYEGPARGSSLTTSL